MKSLFLLFFLVANFSGIIAQTTPAATDTSSVHIIGKMEIKTSTIGDEEAWKRYLMSYLNFMVPYDNGAPIGNYTVIVQFIIEENGNVSDVKAHTNFGYGMEEEVVRLIKKGPKWSPAIKDGKPIKAYQKRPVTFVVMGDGIEINSEKPYELYTEIDNTVTIKVDNFKDKDLHVTISQGSIVSQGEGNYIVKVNKEGRAIITIYDAKKGNKEIGAASLEVKPLSQSPNTQ